MTPIASMAKFEDDLLTWAETDKVFNLLLRGELINSKMFEEFLQKSVAEHWKSFDKNKPSPI
ncbi:hypothetical protein F511_34305 [Dorcoceras hygrometricum]|uniref:Uncharacterized protein n=1 Tax=Dorcoceras hygrometricum TaxID=472368 RepID=A0A2Z7BDZ0_9LAMI|nr:hypothetical protein F511_34305 [Dorcoceras hygrometricum]